MNTPHQESALSRAIQLAIISLSIAHGAGHASKIEVPSNDDNGNGCTLREALNSVNAQTTQGGCVNSGTPFSTDHHIVFSDALHAPKYFTHLNPGE